MNDRDLERILDSIHQRRAQLSDPPQLHERARRVPLQLPRRRSWLPDIKRGRFEVMFSATKFVVAGAIVALFGSVLVSGMLAPTRPTDSNPVGASSTATIAAGPEENEFFGKLIFKAPLYDGPPGVIQYSYDVDEMSDPRLDGDYVLSYTESMVVFGVHVEPLYHASFRIQNDEGAWQEEPNLTLEFPDGSASSRTSALVGEGGYAGLTAIAEITYIPAGRFEIHGVITNRPAPDAPVLASPDQ